MTRASQAILVALALLAPGVALAQSGGGSVIDAPASYPHFAANATVVDNAGPMSVAFSLDVTEPNGEGDVKLVGLVMGGAASATLYHAVTAAERSAVAEPAEFGADGFKVWTGASAIDGKLFVKHRWNVTAATALGNYSWQGGSMSQAGMVNLTATTVYVTVTAASRIDVAPTPVSAAGAPLTGTSWGAWEADPGQANVAAGNYLKLTNFGSVARPRVVLDFSGASFAGADARFSVPIASNVAFAWWEDTTPSASAPQEGTFTPLLPNAEGSTTLSFSGVGNVIYVTYTILQMPAVLPAQPYTAAFTVTEIDPLPDLAHPDPGFAYEDTACDGLYAASADVAIPNASVRDGTYDTGSPKCLVIPSSVGAISASNVLLKSARGVTLGVDVTATVGTLKVDAGTGHVSANGRSLLAKAGLDVVAGAGGVGMNGTLLRSADSYVKIASTGALAAARLNVSAKTAFTATATLVILPNATLGSLSSDISIDATSSTNNVTGGRIVAEGDLDLYSTGNMDVQRTYLKGSGGRGVELDLRASGRTLYVQGASFVDANSRGLAKPSGIVVVGTPLVGSVS